MIFFAAAPLPDLLQPQKRCATVALKGLFSKQIFVLLPRDILKTFSMMCFKEIARGGERTQVLSITFIFSFSPLYR
jgi:hypothetical protein